MIDLARGILRAGALVVLAGAIGLAQNTPADRAGGLARVLTADDVRAVLTVAATALADDTMAAAEHAAEQGWIDAKSLPAIRGEKRMDEGATPGKTGAPAKKASDGTDVATVVDGGAGTVEVTKSPPA